MAYATLAQLKEYLKQLKESDEHDDVLEDVLERATETVDDELGFSFAAYGAAEPADVWSGNGGRYLYLPAYEAASVDSVYLVSGRGRGSESTTEVTDFLEETRWRLFRDAGWTPRAWYRVTAAWGPGPAPTSIVQVTLEVAVTIWQGRSTGNFAAVKGVEGSGAVAYNRALTWDQRTRISRVAQDYRLALR